MYNWENKRQIDYHKNPSFNIIPLALEQYFVKNKDYATFILNHDNFYDFCAGIKKKSDFKLNYYVIKNQEVCVEPQQKVTRYYVSINGGTLMKDYDDGRQVSVESQTLVTPCNKLSNELIKKHFNNINYNYYIHAVKDIIDKIQPKPKNLKLAL